MDVNRSRHKRGDRNQLVRQISNESRTRSVHQLGIARGFGKAADLSNLLPMLLRQIGRDKYVLIIDPIYKLLGLRDENKAGDIASLLNEIEALAVETGAAVAFGAHYSKGTQAGKEVIDRIGGSGVFARDPDSILNFTRHERNDCFTVDATLRNHPPIKPFVARWAYPLMCADNFA
jgi:RecA-family ATPase